MRSMRKASKGRRRGWITLSVALALFLGTAVAFCDTCDPPGNGGSDSAVGAASGPASEGGRSPV